MNIRPIKNQRFAFFSTDAYSFPEQVAFHYQHVFCFLLILHYYLHPFCLLRLLPPFPCQCHVSSYFSRMPSHAYSHTCQEHSVNITVFFITRDYGFFTQKNSGGGELDKETVQLTGRTLVTGSCNVGGLRKSFIQSFCNGSRLPVNI